MKIKEILRRLATPFAPGVTMYVMIRTQVKDQLIKEAQKKLEQAKKGKTDDQVKELEKKYAEKIAIWEIEKKALKDKLQFFTK